ncbi:MAG: branched-chain amino acid ABC transporter ATP-binding protein/permease [Rhizobiales bacterium]|nr:branched-chain amino acid ABC transporter ATP-binding protein/permease [Hyphomicrobiales bacterium]
MTMPATPTLSPSAVPVRQRPSPAMLVNGIIVVLLGLYLVWSGMAAGNYTLRVLSIAGIYALLAIGYQFIFGHAGALALSQGTFMGVGAYASGILAVNYGVPFDLALPISVGLPVLLALIVAAPVLRLETHYFALATLIISQVVLLIAIEWISFTGGANGIGGVPPIRIFSVTIPPGWPLLATVWGFVALGALLAWQIARGRLGQAWACVRTAPSAAAAIGLDASRLRLTAFLLSAAYAGFAGSLYVHALRVISPDVLSFPIIVSCLTIVVVGSRLRPVGALLGALLIILLPEWFRDLRDYYLLAYGCILLLVVVIAPAGLLGTLELLAGQLLPASPSPAPSPRPLEPLAVRGAAVKTSEAAAAPVLDVSRLCCSFGGVRAVDDVSLRVMAGEALGLIGPNGSGKTTLVNLVSGFYVPDSGRIALCGENITGRSSYRIARAGVARTFQTVALVEDMTALDNVSIARDVNRIGLGAALRVGLRDPVQTRAREEAAFLLEQMGAADAMMRPAGSLPYGVRRRVEIARALAVQPTLMLLDEPAAGLNETEQSDLAQRLRALLKQGTALLVIEHNMSFLAPLVDRMACLDAGRLIAEGTPQHVKSDARVLEAYLGTASELVPA